jgi:hypothetical protein
MLGAHQPIEFSQDSRPQLIVVIDTEEEFDWMADPDPKNNTVHAINSIHKVQEIFDEYSIVPCYVVDYPIASQAESVDILKEFLEQGRCEIGAHLHPWVNPPFDEELNRFNTYPGNLDSSLEFRKLKALTDAIKDSFGMQPRAYKAGRYGVGPNTTGIMKKLNYDIDLSVCSAFDYSEDGGPDFSGYGPEPYFFGMSDEMLEIPLSGAYVGHAGDAGRALYQFAGHFDFIRARGILSRLGIVDRLMLSPEGHTPEEHQKLVQHLYRRGVRTFTWNFHSPSVVPGMTFYTQTRQDVDRFLDSFRNFFDFFFDKMNGIASTPVRIKEQLENTL